MKLIPIIYHNKKYPLGITSNIEEVAGHLDKEFIKPKLHYSLHTEYSHMKRKLDSELIKRYPKLIESQKDMVPQLWKDKEWAIQFANFIIDLISNNEAPDIIEVHPPFDDYCDNFDLFFDFYSEFENIIVSKFSDTKIFIENRCGTFYKNGNFLISSASSIIEFLKELSKRNLRLKLVLDYPQVFSAEKIKLDNIKLDKIEAFNNEISKYIKYIGGFHMWGKRKTGNDKRWIPHTGDLNTFFSYNNTLKLSFLNSVLNTFSDDEDRFFVPEVNSNEDDLQSIITDMINAGFNFDTASDINNCDFKQIISFEWKDKIPYINIYDSKNNKFDSINILTIRSIVKGKAIRCIGYKDLNNYKQSICMEHNIVTEKIRQCPSCSSKDIFKYCVMCKGVECHNHSELAHKYCNNEHYVYLAYFPGGKLKVGTAFYERKTTRLMEQGALIAIYIAKAPNGKIAREIERRVVELGYEEKVNGSYKIENLIIDRSKQDIINDLIKNFEIIKTNLNSYHNYFLKKEIFDDYDRRKMIESKLKFSVQNSLFDETKIISNFTECNCFFQNKNILGVIGNFVLLDGESNQYLDIKKLLGWEVSDIN